MNKVTYRHTSYVDPPTTPQERLNNTGPEEFIQSFVKYPPETEVRVITIYSGKDECTSLLRTLFKGPQLQKLYIPLTVMTS